MYYWLEKKEEAEIDCNALDLLLSESLFATPHSFLKIHASKQIYYKNNDYNIRGKKQWVLLILINIQFQGKMSAIKLHFIFYEYRLWGLPNIENINRINEAECLISLCILKLAMQTYEIN